jgi:hypothetical protein
VTSRGTKEKGCAQVEIKLPFDQTSHVKVVTPEAGLYVEMQPPNPEKQE